MLPIKLFQSKLHKILDWLLADLGAVDFSGEWADPSVLRDPTRNLDVRIPQVLEFFGGDLLFVHRDAEAAGLEVRLDEILAAVRRSLVDVPVVCVVPVRMTEAWLLTDEAAIRRAAGNPDGAVPLSLPPIRQLESVVNPKKVLMEALVRASEHTGRRRGVLRQQSARLIHRVAALQASFEALKSLHAFASLEQRVRRVLDENGWAG